MPDKGDPYPVTLAETPFLRLIQQGSWTYAQRPNSIGGIAIVALDPQGCLLLVEQHRIPVGRSVIELPAGLVGDSDELAGESLEQAARRELREETGFDAARVRVLTQGASSAGLTDECVYLLLAEELTRVGPGGGDATEQIIVHAVPPTQVLHWLLEREQAGQLVDFKVYAGLLWLQHLQASQL